ncbi:hypothetical protein E0I00_28635, partial [Pseudomonas syringae pv. actinidiae]|nr:hypothetical protein [Pseudomonas syringae pv. actinidiae]
MPMLRVGMPFWTLCVLCVELRATIGSCTVRWIYIGLKAPFRPSRVTSIDVQLRTSEHRSMYS